VDKLANQLEDAGKENMNDRRQGTTIWREYWREFLIGLIGLACVNAIFISKAFRQSTTVNPEAAGQLGSFVGGYVGAMFALIGIVLLVATLRNQRRAFQLQSFENRYFELIKLHRDNVTEISVGGASGRKFFVLALRELRCILEIVRQVAQSSEQELTVPQLLHVAYYCLFYGVGPNSSRMLKMSLPEFDTGFIDAVEAKLNNDDTKNRIRDERDLPYKPCEGHQSRLGHYYRHLYQMIRYVDQQSLDINKYEYVKTMRAQLSTHEQAMLLVNTRTPLGQIWWENGLLKNYRLVKNLPPGFFERSTELDTEAMFDPGYFEWEETSVNGASQGQRQNRH
jgi:hypothetical protein